MCSKCSSKIMDFNIDNSLDMIYINIFDCELPYVEDMANDIRVQFFYKSYYSIVMGLAIIDDLLVKYDKEYLNKKLGELFKLYSSKDCVINNIEMFRELLIYSRDTYYNECNNYSRGLECGSLLHLEIITINLVRFIIIIRDCLNIEENFNLIFNFNNNMSKLSLDTLDSFIKFKYNNVFSIDIVCNNRNYNKCLTRVVNF